MTLGTVPNAYSSRSAARVRRPESLCAMSFIDVLLGCGLGRVVCGREILADRDPRGRQRLHDGAAAMGDGEHVARSDDVVVDIALLGDPHRAASGVDTNARGIVEADDVAGFEGEIRGFEGEVHIGSLLTDRLASKMG